MKKIIAVASVGGHWVQLLRIAKPLSERYEVVYMSTRTECKKMVSGSFFDIVDFNRRNMWRIVPNILRILKVLVKEKPAAIISTGAAPGLLVIILGRLLGINTIWIDSIANVTCLSACGRVAKIVAKHMYTQWPDLSNEKIRYNGNVLGD